MGNKGLIIRRLIESGDWPMATAAARLRAGIEVVRCSLCAPLTVALVAAFGVPALTGAASENDARARLPRFVSLRSDQVNLRVGPGQTYPIEWLLTRKGMPVEVVREFQNWRMVRVWQDASGWILDRMVTAERHVIVDGAVRVMRRRPEAQSEIVARAEPGVVARLLECQGKWCHIDAGGYQGWLERGDLWGIFPDETVP
jgi:SH3-like domain-containing protein